MLAKVTSCALVGLDPAPVQVEVDITNGLERMTLVGLPDAAVRESAERVRAAITNSGFVFPNHRLTVNLAPADIRKAGPAYDLPIALGILLATRQINTALDDTIILGELSLDGSVRHVNGILPIAAMARRMGFTRLFVPAVDAAEAALVEEIEVYGVPDLAALAAHLAGDAQLARQQSAAYFDAQVEPTYQDDFADIRGQEHAKRALEIACAGAHNIMLKGPPGAGKTLMARALPSILPRLTLAEALDITRIYSVADALPAGSPLVNTRPFRAPHHTISHAGLVGGGSWPKPGEISLAHRGVLFLDEMPEFSSRSLEALRQPLEDHIVTISRASGSLVFPAAFMLVAAMNPCPCGYHPSPRCTCSEGMVQRYQKRLSGPLLDRIDIHLEVAAVEVEKLAGLPQGEPSAVIRRRVEAARARQAARYRGLSKAGIHTNDDMRPAEVQQFCRLDPAGEQILRMAAERMGLTARGYHRVLKLARTIADLAGCEDVQREHVAEALQYRPRTIL